MENTNSITNCKLPFNFRRNSNEREGDLRRHCLLLVFGVRLEFFLGVLPSAPYLKDHHLELGPVELLRAGQDRRSLSGAGWSVEQ